MKFDKYTLHRFSVIFAKKDSTDINYLDGLQLVGLFQKLGFNDYYSYENGDGIIMDSGVKSISRLKYATDRLMILNKKERINEAIKVFVEYVNNSDKAAEEILNVLSLGQNAQKKDNQKTEKSFSHMNSSELVSEIEMTKENSLSEDEEFTNDPVLGHIPRNRKVIFISYSQDNEEHKQWVRKLGDDLSQKGLFVLLDQYNDDGTHLPAFMIRGILKSDKVLIIGTENYKRKFDIGEGGVAFENSIIYNLLYQGGVFTKKFVPCLRHGTFADSFPIGLPNYTGYNFTNDGNYKKEFERLYKSLLSNPNSRRPKLGPMPNDN